MHLIVVTSRDVEFPVLIRLCPIAPQLSGGCEVDFIVHPISCRHYCNAKDAPRSLQAHPTPIHINAHKCWIASERITIAAASTAAVNNFLVRSEDFLVKVGKALLSAGRIALPGSAGRACVATEYALRGKCTPIAAVIDQNVTS
jgi:hypothetical protein